MRAVAEGLAGWASKSVMVRTEVISDAGWVCVAFSSGVMTPGATDQLALLLGEDTILLIPDEAEMSYEPPFVRLTAGNVRFSMTLDPPDRLRV